MLLTNNQIHLWRVNLLDKKYDRLLNSKVLFDHSESEKIRNYRCSQLSRKYVLSHILLRIVISKYTGIPVEEIQFMYSEYGKPFVKSHTVFFNMSHSNTQLIIAIARFNIGIDIEFINYDFDINALTDDVLSEKENRYFNDMTFKMKIKYFFQCWTKKEAYLKALGVGLQDSLNKIDMSFEPCIHFSWVIRQYNTFTPDYTGSLAFPQAIDAKFCYFHSDKLFEESLDS